MADVPRRTQWIAASTAIVLGLLTALLVDLHPEGLRAPAWVAYVAASAFVLAGLSLAARNMELASLSRWLVAGVVAAMLAVTAWLAFGPGERACGMSIGFVQGVGPDSVCRGAFGLSTLFIAIVLFLIVRPAR